MMNTKGYQGCRPHHRPRPRGWRSRWRNHRSRHPKRGRQVRKEPHGEVPEKDFLVEIDKKLFTLFFTYQEKKPGGITAWLFLLQST